MDEDFKNFITSYINGKFSEFVKTKEEKMEIDLSSKENFTKFLEQFEKEIINVNINLLYAYHQWLKSEDKIK